jgi:hypothetical protein
MVEIDLFIFQTYAYVENEIIQVLLPNSVHKSNMLQVCFLTF